MKKLLAMAILIAIAPWTLKTSTAPSAYEKCTNKCTETSQTCKDECKTDITSRPSDMLLAKINQCIGCCIKGEAICLKKCQKKHKVPLTTTSCKAIFDKIYEGKI